MNLELLRTTRVKRMGVKGAGHSGQKRIFFVLDRATKKFPGNVVLWLQYIEYAKKQKSYKKLSQIFTTVLRLHPSSPELWILAANYALIEREDVTEARSYLQRGLRFRRQSKDLWIEFARLEMVYMAQLSRRIRVLGVEEDTSKKLQAHNQDVNEDLILLPTEDDSITNLGSSDQRALKALISTPALSGAIPKAVYDGAIAEFPRDIELKTRFFDLFADHGDVACASNLCEYVLDDLMRKDPAAPETLSCRIRLPFVGVDPTGPEFPAALINLLKTNEFQQKELPSMDACYLKAENTRARAIFASRTLLWIVPYLSTDGIDDACRRAIHQMTNALWGRYQLCIQDDAGIDDPGRQSVEELMQTCGIQ